MHLSSAFSFIRQHCVRIKKYATGEGTFLVLRQLNPHTIGASNYQLTALRNVTIYKSLIIDDLLVGTHIANVTENNDVNNATTQR